MISKRSRLLAASILPLAAGLWFLGRLCGSSVQVILSVSMGQMLLLFLSTLMLCVSATEYWHLNKRQRFWYGLLGCSFSLSQALAIRLNSMGHTGLDGWIWCFLFSICLWPSAAGVFWLLSKLLSRLGKPIVLSSRQAGWIPFLLMVICWLPTYLTFFPGINGYDTFMQLKQLCEGSYSTHHPLAHTLLTGLFYTTGEYLGSPTLGFAAYTAVQYLCLAGAVSYALQYLASLKVPRILWWALTLSYALLIQHSVMAVSATKDIFFACGILVLTIRLHRLLRSSNPSRFDWLSCTLLTAGVCLFRNNMIYALAALSLALLVIKRLGGRRLAVLFLAGCLLASICSTTLQAITDAEDGSKKEMLSVPIQQMARVYHLYGLNAPVGYEIREVLPLAERYRPEMADHVKGTAQVDGPGELTRFVKLWLRESIRYPVEYLDAFLFVTKGYWDINDRSFASIYAPYGAHFNGPMVALCDSIYGIEARQLLPGLHKWFEEMFWSNGYQQYPVRWLLLQPGLYSWMLAFAAVLAIINRRKDILLPCLMLLLYLGTLLLGPCALIRYHYCIMITVPMLLGLLAAESPSKNL